MPAIAVCEECHAVYSEGSVRLLERSLSALGWEDSGTRLRCPQCVSKGPPKPLALLEAERLAQGARFEHSMGLLGL